MLKRVTPGRVRARSEWQLRSENRIRPPTGGQQADLRFELRPASVARGSGRGSSVVNCAALKRWLRFHSA
jgi:hypothetical protein